MSYVDTPLVYAYGFDVWWKVSPAATSWDGLTITVKTS